MDKEHVQKAIEALRKNSPRKFTQSYDLIINLKNIAINTSPIDTFVTLHFPKGKKVNVAAFVDQLLAEQAKEHCDLVIKDADFEKYKDKQNAKRLASGYDYFIAQANLMPKVAQYFGKVLGVKGKMPNPKLGCVVPPNANLDALVKKLNHTVRLKAVKATNIQCMVGKENQPAEQIADNVLTVYHALVKQLPNEMQNIKNVQLKLTMGKPVKL